MKISTLVIYDYDRFVEMQSYWDSQLKDYLENALVSNCMLSELWKYAQYFGWTPFVVIFQSENKMVGFVGLHYNKKHFMKFSFKEIIKIYGLETIRATLYFLTNLFENIQPNQLHLEIIAVDEKQRTKGIETKLLLSTIEYAKQKVFHQIRI